ncbi:MAG: dUTP diphosphatase [Mycoplasma sp.]
MKNKKMSKEEKVKMMIDNFSDEFGNVSLMGCDFGDKVLKLNHIKAKEIDNSDQIAQEWIHNYRQKAKNITNGAQLADYIDNSLQQGDMIEDYGQENYSEVLGFKKIREGIIGIKEPAIEGDAGYDLYCFQEETIESRKSKCINTGIAFEIPKGYWIEIMPKSGLATKYNLTVHNGVIDNGYRGEIVVQIYNHSDKDYTFKKDEKIAQCVIRKLHNFVLDEVIELEETTRGTNGFGSTGK